MNQSFIPSAMNEPSWNQPNQYGSFVAVMVSGEAGAAAYPVAAGNTVLLIDFDSKTFWLKTTDANRIPQPLRKFEFTEIIQQPQTIQNGVETVTREEFQQLSEKLNKLIEGLGGA